MNSFGPGEMSGPLTLRYFREISASNSDPDFILNPKDQTRYLVAGFLPFSLSIKTKLSFRANSFFAFDLFFLF
jgi:hypothetical protein